MTDELSAAMLRHGRGSVQLVLTIHVPLGPNATDC